jgi:hypothetical protein
MSELDESISLVRQDVDVLDFSPNREVPQQYLVHLSHSVFVTWQTILADIESLGLFGETTNTLHVFTEATESGSAENVLRLVDALAVFNAGHFVIVATVDSVGAAATREEETVVGCTLFIEEISCCVSDIEFGVAPGQGSFFIFFVLGADVLAEPKVVLLVSFLVSVIVGQ